MLMHKVAFFMKVPCDCFSYNRTKLQVSDTPDMHSLTNRCLGTQNILESDLADLLPVGLSSGLERCLMRSQLANLAKIGSQVGLSGSTATSLSGSCITT